MLTGINAYLLHFVEVQTVWYWIQGIEMKHDQRIRATFLKPKIGFASTFPEVKL